MSLGYILLKVGLKVTNKNDIEKLKPFYLTILLLFQKNSKVFNVFLFSLFMGNELKWANLNNVFYFWLYSQGSKDLSNILYIYNIIRIYPGIYF